ncbi:polysaccharide pyruvyl transferase family protein [Microbacterium lacticum]
MFVSAVGQDTNVGDSVLRRGYLDALRTVGQIHVLVSGTSGDYRDGLGLQEDDVAYDSRDAWWSDAYAAAKRGPVVVAFNAGEMQLNRTFALSYARHANLIRRAKRRGGFGVHLGMGIRSNSAWRVPVGAMLRVCDEVAWRDPSSRDWAGVGTVAPDWAFSFASTATGSDRNRIAIALRGDRDGRLDQWAEVVATTAQESSLSPVVVVQVERDNELARRLGAQYGWEVSEWRGGSHAKREAEIRAIYGACAAVVSDRLHALVIGATEGAVPVAYAPTSVDKSRRTLAGVGLGDFFVPHDALPTDAVPRIAGLLARDEFVSERLAAARNDLTTLTSRIAAN